jgi:hypothetical protein
VDYITSNAPVQNWVLVASGQDEYTLSIVYYFSDLDPLYIKLIDQFEQGEPDRGPIWLLVVVRELNQINFFEGITSGC